MSKSGRRPARRKRGVLFLGVFVVAVFSGSLQAQTVPSPTAQPTQSATTVESNAGGAKAAAIAARASVIVAVIGGIAAVIAAVISGIALVRSNRIGKQAAQKISLDDLLREGNIEAIRKQGNFLTPDTLLEAFMGRVGTKVEEFEGFRRLLLEPMISRTLDERIKVAYKLPDEINELLKSKAPP